MLFDSMLCIANVLIAYMLCSQIYPFTGEPIWPSGKIGIENAPADAPACGFKNENCKVDGEYLLLHCYHNQHRAY